MCRQYLATMTYFNGRYWSHPEITRRVDGSNWRTAFARAARLAHKLMPKGTRPEEIRITIKPLKEMKLKEGDNG